MRSPAPCSAATAAREDTDEALGLLASYSMITLTTETVSIHRLLQAVILARPDSTGDDMRSLRDTALDWLNTAIPDAPATNMAGWPLLRALVPHAETLASHFPPGDQPEALGRVQNEIALFLTSQGDYAQALSLRQSALAIAKATFGPNHPTTASALSSLAATYHRLGRPADALPLQERALAITEAALGPDHPDHGHLAGQPRRHLPRPWAATPTRCRCGSGRWPSPRRPWDPTTPNTAVRLGQPRRHLP